MRADLLIGRLYPPQLFRLPEPPFSCVKGGATSILPRSFINAQEDLVLCQLLAPSKHPTNPAAQLCQESGETALNSPLVVDTAGRLLTATPGQFVLSTASRSDRQASWQLQSSGSKGMIPERKTPEEPGSLLFHPHATKSAPGVQLSLIRGSCGIPVLSQTPESPLRCG